MRIFGYFLNWIHLIRLTLEICCLTLEAQMDFVTEAMLCKGFRPGDGKPLTYADKLGHCECSVNFWQLFCLDVFWLVFDFCLFQKMHQRICIKFCVKNKIKCADAFRMLTVAYGEATLDSLARTSGSPRPKKARQVRSNVKVLLTVFFDRRGVVHHEFLPQGRTVNKEYYLQVMRNLREAIRQKRPDLWKNKNWLLHPDNAPAHTSLLVRKFLAKNNTLMMPQPPYPADLAPCDFFLFPKLKRPMKGRHYATIEEIKAASKEELNKIKKNDFLKCFEDWKKRWHKCIISDGDYFEGDKIEIHGKINTFEKIQNSRYFLNRPRICAQTNIWLACSAL